MDPVPKSDDTDLLTAMLAGAVSGAFEATATYPFEFYKTTSQIQNLALMSKLPSEPDSIKRLYTGCGALSLGNALKASTRMMIFNSASQFMETDAGQTTAPRVVVAGLMTGFVETLWVIPFENIKTRLIQNSMFINGMKMKTPRELADEAAAVEAAEAGHQPVTHKTTKVKKIHSSSSSSSSSSGSGVKTSKRPSSGPSVAANAGKINPANLNAVHGPTIPKNAVPSPEQAKAIEYYTQHPSTTFRGVCKEIYATQGLRGFKQGSLVTVLRQCMNSMVWYSSYNSLRQTLDPNRDSMTDFGLLGVGLASSLAVVAVTQPLDLIKTRMQTKDYRMYYKDFMTCAYRTLAEEGFRKFWSGWLPRLIKVSCSSSVTLVTYDYTVQGINKLKGMKPFEPK